MNQAPSPWAWVRRALAVAVLLMLAGWAVALLGVFTLPWVGLVGGVAVLLVGGFWAARHIGGAGAGAALIGLIAAIGMSPEARYVWVARTAPVVELPSLSGWNPAGPDHALHVHELRHLRRLQVAAKERVGMGKNAFAIDQVVTPLFDARENRVVGFNCRTVRERRASRDGSWVLSRAALTGDSHPPCGGGARRAMAACAQAGLAVDEAAVSRVVEVFPSEQDLRQAYNLGPALGVPLGFLLLYAMLVVGFRRRGAGATG